MIGRSLAQYRVTASIGAGGMGEVYRATDARLGRDVAIKVLPATVASDPDRRQRFEQEARAASALNHPNILTVYDIGEADGTTYIAMELVEGKTLRELVASGDAMPVKRLLDIAVQIAQEPIGADVSPDRSPRNGECPDLRCAAVDGPPP